MNNKAESKQSTLHDKSIGALSLLNVTVLATAVAGLLYFAYFQLAPWIWSKNLPIRPGEITPWFLQWVVERDGIELYALYVLMFLDLFLVFLLSYGWQMMAGKTARYLLVLPLVIACAFLISVGFHPPVNTMAAHTISEIFRWSFGLLIVILPVTALLYYLHLRSSYLVLAVVALLLIPVCFISTEPIEWYDYSFVLAPSLRLFHGVGISKIYFPYDLFLSLIGLAWIKLRLDPNSIQIVGQCAYYLMLLGAFAFSRRWLIDKRLPILLLMALVLVRIYAGPGDAVHSFQGTPFRYDTWLILLMLVYFKGANHWSTGVYCGFLLLFHNNFGIIYSAAYIQMLMVLCVTDMATMPKLAIKSISLAFKTAMIKNYRNLAIMLSCALVHYLLFRNPDVPNDYNYVRLGIGFIRILTDSFYWYVVIVSGLSFTLLLKLRSRFSANYFEAGLCLIFLAIGNSLYFFGRSHENAIIVLSPVFLLLFFLLLDLAGHFLANGTGSSAKLFIHRNLTVIVSLVFIVLVTIWYGDNITRKATIQVRNAAVGQFIYPSEVPERYILNTIAQVRSVAGNNPKVYFLGDYDFLFDYYGGYAPVGYYNPVYAWISRPEFNKFLQGLVDQGYYLVVDDGLVDVLSPIRFSNSKNIGRRWVVWK